MHTSLSPAAPRNARQSSQRNRQKQRHWRSGRCRQSLRPDRLFEIVKKEKGHIDVIFASAGFGEINNPLGSITEKGFDDTFNVNVRGTLFTVQKALPLMKDGGSIILNSSIAGVKGFPGTTVYSASKAAVRSFARTWTAELKGKIRVNVISPGTIDTAIFDGVPQELKDRFVSIIPMGRVGKPTRSRLLPLFLASNDSSLRYRHRALCGRRHSSGLIVAINNFAK